MTDRTRDALLAAIVRSRGWLDAIMTEQLSSFEQIAEKEKLAEKPVLNARSTKLRRKRGRERTRRAEWQSRQYPAFGRTP
jgi:hypothetical protein